MSDQSDQQKPQGEVPMASPVFVPPIPPPAAAAPHEPSLGERMLLPIGRSGWAIAAGYLGLFCLAVVPGPIALIVSLIAIVDLRKHRKKGGWGRAIFGLIMGLLSTAILLLFAIAWWEEFVRDVR